MRTEQKQTLASRGIAKVLKLNKLKIILVVLLFGNFLKAQNLSISSTGETGVSGTNWSISGNELLLTGTADIRASVLTAALTNGNVIIKGASLNVNVTVSESINYTSNSSNLTIGEVLNTGTIQVNASVTLGGTIVMNASNVILSANVTTSLPSGNGIQINSNQLTINPVALTTQGSNITFTIANSPFTTTNDNGIVFLGTSSNRVTVNANGGNINLTAAFDGTGTLGTSADRAISVNSTDIRTSGSGIITILGDASNNLNTVGSAWGIQLSNSTIQTTTGAIHVKGIGGKASVNSRGIGVDRQNLKIVSQSGAILVEDDKPLNFTGTNGGLYLRPDSVTNIFIGADGSLVTSSTSSITLKSDKLYLELSETNSKMVQLNSSGAIVLDSYANTFETISLTGFQTAGNPLSLLIGKTTNTANVTITNNLTIAGPITINGGNLTIGGILTSSNTGDVIFKSNLTNTSSASSLYTNAQILKTGGQRSKILLQSQGRLNFGSSGKIEATNTIADVILWSDFDNSNNDGGTTVYANIITNGGHVWWGGSNSNGGTTTWNGLTVGDGPSIGTTSSNLNAIDYASNITTSGGDVFIWAGNGATNGGNVGINGIEVYTSDRTINAGTGNITVITNAGVKTNSLILKTTGKISIAPNAASFTNNPFVFNGTLSGANFVGSNSLDKIRIDNFSSVGELNLGFYTDANGWNFVNSGPININADVTTNASIRLNANTINLNANLKTQNTGNLYLKGNTTISAGKMLECAGNFTHDGNLIFKSSATGTATFGVLGGTFSTLSGTATVERFIPQGKRAFRLLSPAVTTTTFISGNWQQGTHITGSTTGANGFDATETGNPSMFTYNNQAVSGSGWTPIANTNATNLTAGVGYRMLVRGDRNVNITVASLDNMNAAVTLIATGTLKTGTVTLNLNSTPAINNTSNITTADYSLVGNPYQSAVDWNAVTKSGIDATYYAWDPNMGTSTQRGRYVAFNGTINDNVSSQVGQYIQPGQAFFVKNTVSGTAGTLTFQEAHKATTSASVFRMANQNATSAATTLSVQLYDPNELAIGGYPIDAMKAIFNVNYQNDLGTGDATKLESAGENIAWFRNNTKLAIDAAAPLTATDELLVKTLRLGANKNYVFKIQTTSFDSNLTPYLVDNFLNTQTEISTSQAFTTLFATTTNAASYNENRFKIVFTNNALHTDTFATQIGLYPNPSKGNGFNLQLPAATPVTVTLYNMLGQEIHLTANGTYYQANQPLSTGMYHIKVTQGTQTSTLKWIVE